MFGYACRRHPRADAAADHARAPAGPAAVAGAAQRRDPLPAPGRQDPGHHRVRRRSAGPARHRRGLHPARRRHRPRRNCSPPTSASSSSTPVLEGLDLDTSDYRLLVNPTGRFEIGGPMGDAGLTGRKIIIDTYGGMARHGGGAFSGKDPSKVDRSARLRDALGGQERRRRRPGRPLRGAGRLRDRQGQAGRACSSRPSAPSTRPVERIQDAVLEVFDLRPAAIIRDLDLLRPIYAQTAAYGHFGREVPDFSWERTDRTNALRSAGRACCRRARLQPRSCPTPRRALTDGSGRTGAWHGKRTRRPRRALPAPAAPAATAPRADRARAARAERARTGRRGPPAEHLPVARVAVDVPLAHLDRPFDYLVPAAAGGGRGPRVPGEGAVRRPADGRLPAGAGGRQRASGAAGLSGAGGFARAGAEPGDRGARPGGRRPLRRHPGRRAPAGDPAAARRCRGRWRRRWRKPRAARQPSGTGDGQPLGPAPRPAPGPWARYPAGPAFLAALAEGRAPRAVWSALPGPLWPEEIATGGGGGRVGRAGRAHRGAGRPGPRASSTARWPACSGRAGTPASRPGSGPPSATGAGWPWPAGRCGWWPAPGPPCSPRSATSAWSSSGTTATTCTPSRVPPTRTPGRSSRCGRTGPARAR